MYEKKKKLLKKKKKYILKPGIYIDFKQIIGECLTDYQIETSELKDYLIDEQNFIYLLNNDELDKAIGRLNLESLGEPYTNKEYIEDIRDCLISKLAVEEVEEVVELKIHL